MNMPVISLPSPTRSPRAVRPSGALLALLFTGFAALGANVAGAAPAAWEIDAAHSGVNFQIRHFFAMVPGRFSGFSGNLVFDPTDPAKSSIEFTIDGATVNTDNQKRDEHLRSADFFNVEKFPTLTFKSTKIAKTSEENVYDVAGDFTMLGVTKPVTVRVEVLGVGPDAWGNTRAGFEVTGKVNRKDFGMVWNKVLDNGGTMLSDDVKLDVSLSAVAKKS